MSRPIEKLIRKLATKKYRWQMNMFIAEGRKVVQELLDEGMIAEHVLVKEDSTFHYKGSITLPKEEFNKWSQLSTADEVLAVFRFPEITTPETDRVLVLDKLNDPGNLGTIIRTCDWFGINHVYCTVGTVDVYNAKTIQSTMGSIARVQVSYGSEEEIFETLSGKGFAFWCADMEGENLTVANAPEKLALVMGSESHGPSDFWKEKSHQVTIPRKGNSKTESLNVGIATAIILGHISLSR